MSAAQLYTSVFGRLAGCHPHLRVTHHQYLTMREVYRDLRRVLPSLAGVVVDLGSRDKPYAPWLGPHVTRHIGLDLVADPGVDVVIGGDQRLPLRSAAVDAVLCTQVLEFVDDPSALLAEITRCLRPGGQLVLTVPFIASQHGRGDDDLLRLSAVGASRLVGRWLEVDEVRRQGRAGSTLVALSLTWLHITLSGSRRWLRGPLLPVLLCLHAVLNGLGLVIDKLDLTSCFYGNVLVVAHRSNS